MLSESEKGCLTQQRRDLDRHANSLALFVGIAILGLLLTIATSRAQILSALRLWLLGFFDYQMAWSTRWILGMAIVGAVFELRSLLRSLRANRTLDREHLEQLARSDPAAFNELAKRLKKSS
jgi:hypothetical protein